MKENRDWLEIEVVTESLLFEKLPTVFDVMEDHCESISIPVGFELLASSDECINEAMQHKNKMIYGLQFHPEVSGNFGRVIIENFVNCSI
jgi:GMP synthase (glutamine-hydrolysing)